MRRAVLSILLAGALVASGCGGSHHQSTTALDDAVGYFAKDAPLVAAVDTNRDGDQLKQLAKLVRRFPGSDVLAVRLATFARLRNADLGRDIEPQLGAPLVVGLIKPAAGKDLPTATVAAMRVKHPLQVKQLLLREPGFRGSGKESGVRVYEDPQDSRYAAVDGHMVVAATNRDILAEALAMRRSENRMHASGFSRDLKGLPAGGFFKATVDPRAMIGVDPHLRPALNVKWLASMHRMAVTAKAATDGISVDMRIATDRGSVSDKDLPIAPGSKQLPLIGGKDETRLAIAQPDRLVRLALQVWQAMSPTRALALRALEPGGVDLTRQLPHHLTGPLAVAFNTSSKTFALRSRLTESSDVRAALQVLAPALPALGSFFGFKGLGLATPDTGENFYALATPKGWTAVFAVLGDSLVAASDAHRAADLVSEPAQTSSARGGVVFTVDAKALATDQLARRLTGAARLFAPFELSALHDFTGGFTITRDGLRVQAKLTIR